MRNLIYFFQKYSSVFIFLILQLICMVFIFSNTNPYQHAKFANSSNALVGNIYTQINAIKSYFYLTEEVEQLRAQNTLLQNQCKTNAILVGDYFSVKEDTLYMQQYEYQPAKVIRSTKNKAYNYLTLNVGLSNKVKEDMGVVGTKGVVGYVVASSNHFSTVLPIIHPKFILPVRHQKTKTFGLLSWEENNDYKTATIRDIASFIKVDIGDTIVTTGGDFYFPEGELIGVVKQTEEIEGKGTLLITVELAEDYGSLYNVYTINNIAKIELEELKDSTEVNE